jgi:hypothetical protein
MISRCTLELDEALNAELRRVMHRAGLPWNGSDETWLADLDAAMWSFQYRRRDPAR